MNKQINKIKNYLSLVTFSHTVFAMPFALIGFFIAVKQMGYDFKWEILVFVILCMIFARNAAMAFNRYADREIDLKNPRTLLRELPAGIIKPKSALRFVIINSLLFITTTYFINKLTFLLSPVALIIILVYSITKKFTYLCHFILGIGLSLAPIGAFLSVSGSFTDYNGHIYWMPLIYSLIVILWVTGFDIIYALQDHEFDENENLKSIPVWLGKKKSLIFSFGIHTVAAALIILTGVFYNFNYIYWIGASIFLLLLLYQHMIIKPDDLSKLNIAFFVTNGVASIIYALFTILSFYIKIKR
jgi:4-hydroxybenzoate polyprenyltransferase